MPTSTLRRLFLALPALLLLAADRPAMAQGSGDLHVCRFEMPGADGNRRSVTGRIFIDDSERLFFAFGSGRRMQEFERYRQGLYLRDGGGFIEGLSIRPGISGPGTEAPRYFRVTLSERSAVRPAAVTGDCNFAPQSGGVLEP
ncbi:hypothetical protein MWU52_06170 [Jannaschia sp. S6380]|uniref:hypothetical protein n=1 Tax=Jannaschia sp. S6380 TaxID=2926408 RepID=UPI001FF2E965|nr:hypothetical protein [Jannaschia sp. S6380]MCK0167129.1 hypothetical protein [Jannaschia sp. S6380]